MEGKSVISLVAIALVIGLGIGSVFLPVGVPPRTKTNFQPALYTYTVTSTYTTTNTSIAWVALVGRVNRSSTSVTTYYKVCVFVLVYGYTWTSLDVTLTPFVTSSSTSVAVTTSSAPAGYIVGVGGTNGSCTYVSTVSKP